MEELQSDISAWKARAELAEEELVQREKQCKDARAQLQEKDAEYKALAQRLASRVAQVERTEQALNAAKATIVRETNARDRSEAALKKQISVTDNLRLELKLLSSKTARLLEERVTLLMMGSQCIPDPEPEKQSASVEDTSAVQLDLYEFLADSEQGNAIDENTPEVFVTSKENTTDQELPNVAAAPPESSGVNAKSRLRAMITKRFGGGSLQSQDDFQQSVMSLAEVQPTRHVVRVFAGPSVDRLRQVAASSSESSHVPASIRGALWETSVGNRLRLTHEQFGRVCRRRDTLRGLVAAAKEKEVAGIGAACIAIAPINSPDTSQREHIEENRSSEEGLQRCVTDMDSEKHIERGELCLDCTQDLELIKKGMQQIALDLNRTFQARDLAGFQTEDTEPLQDRLRDVLEAFVVLQPEYGYTQGMSFIAALMLLHMNVMQAFVCFSNVILLQPWLTACYSFDMVVIRRYFDIFHEVLLVCVPKVGMHFQALGLQAEVFLIEWWFTLFSRSLPLPIVVRLWDMFFLDGDFLLYKASLAILQYFSEALLSRSRDECLAVLSSWPSHHLELASFFETFGKVTLTEKKLSAAFSKVQRRSQRTELEGNSESGQQRPSLVRKR